MSTRLRELAITSLWVNEDWIACRASQQSASQTTFDLRPLGRHDEASRLALAHHSADWKQIGCRRLMLLAQTPLRTRSVLQKRQVELWRSSYFKSAGAIREPPVRRFALDEVGAARDVDQRARNHDCDQSSSGSGRRSVGVSLIWSRRSAPQFRVELRVPLWVFVQAPKDGAARIPDTRDLGFRKGLNRQVLQPAMEGVEV